LIDGNAMIIARNENDSKNADNLDEKVTANAGEHDS